MNDLLGITKNLQNFKKFSKANLPVKNDTSLEKSVAMTTLQATIDCKRFQNDNHTKGQKVSSAYCKLIEHSKAKTCRGGGGGGDLYRSSLFR